MSEDQERRGSSVDPGDPGEGGANPGPQPGTEAGKQASQPAGQAGQDDTDVPSAAAPPDRLTTLEAEKNDARERMLRIAAEFENYKKRVRKEQSESEAKARESVLRDMLEIIDNLERAAAVGE